MNYTAALICLISIAIISEGRHISNQDFDTVYHLQANEGYRMKRSLPDPSRNTFPQFVNVFQHTALKTFGCGGCGGCGCRSCGGCAAKKRAAAALLKAMKRARSRQRSAVSQKNRNSIVKEGGMASVGGGGGGASRGGGGGISRGGGGGISRGGGGSISRGGGTGGSGGGYAGGTAGSGSMSRTGSGSKSGSGSSSAGGSSSSGVVININNYGTSSGHHGQSGQDVHAKAENYSAGSANAGTDIHIGGKNDDGNFRSVMSRKQKHGVNAKQRSQTNVVNKG